MEFKKYRAAIEAILFATGEPVSADRFAEVLELDAETVHRIAADMMSELLARDGGILRLPRPAAAKYASSSSSARCKRR